MPPAFRPFQPQDRGLRGGHITAVLLAALAVTGCAAAYLHFRPAPPSMPSVEAGLVVAAPTPRDEPPPAPGLIDAVLSGPGRHTPTAASGLRRVPLDDTTMAQVEPLLGRAEARLIRVYQHIRAGDHRQALKLAEHLARDHPNFQLAQLVLGDLLALRARPLRTLGDVPDIHGETATAQLAALREESNQRIRALTERPPEGHVPRQFLALSPKNRHAIAIDTSRSRLYLFENLAPSDRSESRPATAPRLRLIGDYYISVGLQGIAKEVEGDQRTPLGVYYITSTLDPRKLPDLYGVGALPINYPNALDQQRGKTGSGIWLHGTPREQFVRAPQASDGCVVLSNQDLAFLLKTVRIRTTPVVIAQHLEWVVPDSLEQERQHFTRALDRWRQARSTGDVQGLRAFYSKRFQPGGNDTRAWWRRMEAELRRPRPVQLKDTSLLKWQDSEETMVVTFGEVPVGQRRGTNRRQYWALENGQWKIIYEGNT